MKIDYKTNNSNSGISIDDYISCESFRIGDSIICMNDEFTMNITKNLTYEALYIYESNCPKSNNRIMFVQISDDGDEICGYEVERFISIKNHREDQLSKILD